MQHAQQNISDIINHYRSGILSNLPQPLRTQPYQINIKKWLRNYLYHNYVKLKKILSAITQLLTPKSRFNNKIAEQQHKFISMIDGVINTPNKIQTKKKLILPKYTEIFSKEDTIYYLKALGFEISNNENEPLDVRNPKNSIRYISLCFELNSNSKVADKVLEISKNYRTTSYTNKFIFSVCNEFYKYYGQGE